VLAIVRVEEGSGHPPYRVTIQLYNGKTYRGCIGALTPVEVAALIKQCPRCKRELRAKPTKIKVKKAGEHST
jgi:ssDNA-binding replication factor A large subunit